ncbi:MAG: hypothetical protein IJY46_01060 [Lentisphaeria bacterium]|nr:hypothetical protein [Lentisphaeria bacterium]
MKKTLLLLTASAAMLLHAAPDAAQVFNRTTCYIDMDGSSLMYYNTGELVKLLYQLPAFAANAAKSMDTKPENAQLIKDGGEIILKLLNPDAVKAMACSTKELPGNIHITKGVFYLGDAAHLPGLFNVAKFKNDLALNAELASLPADVICAVKFKAAFDFARIDKVINENPNAQIKMYWNMFKTAAAQYGADINKICTGTSGNFSLIIAGTDETSLRMTLTIPDENGSLSALLKRFLPPDPQAPERVSVPVPGMAKFGKPTVVFQDKKIVLMSDYQRCTKTYPAFKAQAALRRQLPANAAAYTVINLSEAGIAGIRKYAPAGTRAATIAAALKPVCVMSASVIERDAIRDITAMNFSIANMSYEFNLLLNSAK